MQEFTVGTRAVIDSFGGLIPCEVTAVREACEGRTVTGDAVTVKVLTSRKGYRKGETLTGSAFKFPPRKMVKTRSGMLRVNVNYRYVPAQ
jgi:hypothetical protein